MIPLAAKECTHFSSAATLDSSLNLCGGVMYKFILVLFLLPITALADEWTDADTKRETVFFGIRTFTYLQTYTVAKYGWQGYYEQNKILGKFPHQDRVTAYYAIHSLVHFGVSYILPTEWRQGFQYITIGEVGAAAYSNHASGVRVKFLF